MPNSYDGNTKAHGPNYRPRAMFSWIIENKEKVCNALYYLGGAFFIVHFAISVSVGSIHHITPFLLISAIMFAVGFITWMLPLIRSAVSSPVTSFIFIIAQSLVVILSLILARETVSSATGLPPQDFDLTVIGVSFVYYLYFWLLITSVLTAVPLLLALAASLLIFMILILFVPFVVLFIVYPLAFLLSIFSPKILPTLELLFSKYNSWIHSASKNSNRYSGHYFGALAVSAYLISPTVWLDSNDEILERQARRRLSR